MGGGVDPPCVLSSDAALVNTHKRVAVAGGEGFLEGGGILRGGGGKWAM